MNDPTGEFDLSDAESLFTDDDREDWELNEEWDLSIYE